MTLNAAGGTGTATVTPAYTGLLAGVHVFTATDANGCTATTSATITQPTVLSISKTSTNVSCNAGNNGTINITPSGGTAPYTYNWGGGVTTQNRTGLAAKTYVVTVTDANGCTATNTTTLTQPSAIIISGGTVNPTCNGAANGSIFSSASGGISPYTYKWSNGATTSMISGLVVGSYSLTVTDANGCKALAYANLIQPAMYISNASTDVTCNGGSNGVINISSSGGVSPYTYNWGGGVTTQNRTGLAAGSYTVTVTDANGCTATNTTTLTQPSAIIISGGTVNPTCNGAANGSILFSASGSPYAYKWSNGATTSMISGLVAGSYSLTVTNVIGCKAVTSATLTQPTALSISKTSTNVPCNGGANGTINITPSGGTGAFTYNWGGGVTTQNRTGLAAGTYTVTVTDANFCTATNTTTLIEPTAVSISKTSTQPTCNAASGTLNGTITITPSGGTGAYTYNWGGGVTTQNRTGLGSGTYTVTVTDANGCTASNTTTLTEPTAVYNNVVATYPVTCFGGGNGSVTLNAAGGTGVSTVTPAYTGLAAGMYVFTATDANGCTATTSATITQPTALSISKTSTGISCNGGANGTINITPSGGTGAYTYNWGGGVTTQNRTGLAAGTYTVTVMDANLCTATNTTTLTEPTAITISKTSTNSCNAGTNGTINITPSGGTSPYTYNWGGGITTQNRTGLGAGTYVVTVTDANGCTATNTTTLIEPTPLVATASASSSVSSIVSTTGTGTPNLGCTNFTATSRFSLFGIPPTCASPKVFPGTTSINNNNDVYLMTNPSATPVCVTMTLIGSSTDFVHVSVYKTPFVPASVVVAGEYIADCTISSKNSVPRTFSFTLAGNQTVAVVLTNPYNNTNNNPYTLTLSTPLLLSNPVVACHGGTTTVTVTGSGGTAPYTGTGAFTVGAGVHNYTVTDANGCTQSTSITVTQPAAPLSVTVSSSAVATPSGGTAPYKYLWNTGETTQAQASPLPGGTYFVTVTDAFGCTVSSSNTLAATCGITISKTSTNVSCNAGTNGTINITPSGGVSPYTYNWGGGVTTQNRTGVGSGTYTVTVTDANGCTATNTTTLTQPSAIIIVIAFTAPKCNGSANGLLSVNSPSNGTSPYTYNWSNGKTTQDNFNVPAGTYTVTVTDANGCTATETVVLQQPPPLTVTVSSSAVATPSGGINPYNYLWNTGETTQAQASPLPGGTYFVTVTDVLGCTVSSSNTLTAACGITISKTSTNISCNGGTTGTINITPSGGTSPYTYNWGGGITTQNRTGLGAGTYVVTVTDANGCTATNTTTLIEPTPLVATASASSSVSSIVSTTGTGTPNLGCTNFTATSRLSRNGIFPTCASQKAFPGTNSGNNINDLYLMTNPSATPVCVTMILISSIPTGGVHASVHKTPFVPANVAVAGEYIADSGNSSINNTPWSFSFTLAGNQTVAVVLTNPNNNTSNRPYTLTLSTPLLLAAPVVACHGGTATVNVIGSGGTAPYTGTGAFTVGAGVHNYTVTDANGCTQSTSITVTQPAAPLSVTVSSSAVATPTGGTAPYKYLWSNGQTTQTATGLSSGTTYMVTVTDANGCTATANYLAPSAPTKQISKKDDVVLPQGNKDDLKEITITTDVLLYPNPASTMANFRFLNENITDFDLQVLDMTGKSIEYKTFQQGNILSLDISNYMNGVYLLKFIVKNEKPIVKRLVVQKM